jgi:hypothetical protein
MKELNGIKYKLMLIDTGVVSKIIKNPDSERNKLTKIIISQNAIPCFSIFPIYELRKRPELYAIFLEIFSLVPFFLLKTSEMLFDEELNRYPHPTDVEPIAFTFTFVNKDPLGQLKNFMSRLFSDPGVINNESVEFWLEEGRPR